MSIKSDSAVSEYVGGLVYGDVAIVDTVGAVPVVWLN